MSDPAAIPKNEGAGVDRLSSLLGEDVFFVPCEWGTKKPLVTYVERPLEGTKSPAYRALFESGPCNIAVYLGKASGGLCAIDFDADEDLAAFLAVNPKLARTTRSRGSRGGMVWVRILPPGRALSPKAPLPEFPCTEGGALGERALPGGYPASCTTAHFEWRADKRLSTIAGRHP